MEDLFLKSTSNIDSIILPVLIVLAALAPPAELTPDPSFITQFHFKVGSPIVIELLATPYLTPPSLLATCDSTFFPV